MRKFYSLLSHIFGANIPGSVGLTYINVWVLIKVWGWKEAKWVLFISSGPHMGEKKTKIAFFLVYRLWTPPWITFLSSFLPICYYFACSRDCMARNLTKAREWAFLTVDPLLIQRYSWKPLPHESLLKILYSLRSREKVMFISLYYNLHLELDGHEVKIGPQE